MESTGTQRSFSPQPGDCMLSHAAYPEPERIVLLGASDDHRFGFGSKSSAPLFQPTHLARYLNFLELLVLYNRFLVVSVDVPSAHRYVTLLPGRGAASIDPQAMDDALTTQGILTRGILQSAGDAAQSYVADYMPKLPELRRRFEELRTTYRSDDAGVQESYALRRLAETFGAVSIVDKYARDSSLPYFVSPRESGYLVEAERSEVAAQRGLVSHLKRCLDGGAAELIERLAHFGVPRPCIATPIASLILNEAQQPSDLLKVALQLRDDYESFRQHLTELETRLFAERTPIEEKIRIVKRIAHLADEVWPKGERDIRKSLRVAGDLLSNVVGQVAEISIGRLHEVILRVAEKPFDQIVRMLRRRKIRVLLRAKRNFLKGADSTNKLAHLFGIPAEVVQGETREIEPVPLMLADEEPKSFKDVLSEAGHVEISDLPFMRPDFRYGSDSVLPREQKRTNHPE